MYGESMTKNGKHEMAAANQNSRNSECTLLLVAKLREYLRIDVANPNLCKPVICELDPGLYARLSEERSPECTKIARFSAVAAAILTTPHKLRDF